MDTKKDQETVAKILSTPLNTIAKLSKENLSPELAEIIAREQTRMQKDRKNSFRAQLAAQIASGMMGDVTDARENGEVNLNARAVRDIALLSVGVADAILKEVNREPQS